MKIWFDKQGFIDSIKSTFFFWTKEVYYSATDFLGLFLILFALILDLIFLCIFPAFIFLEFLYTLKIKDWK